MELNAIVDLIQKNPNIFLLVLGIAVGLVFIVLLLLSSVLGKILNISVGPFKFTTSSNQKECPYGEVCKKIKNAVDFYNYDDRSKSLVETIVTETLKLAEEKDRLLFKESITHIMMVVEDVNIKIRNIFTEQYYQELRQALDKEEDVKTHRDYKYFQVLINTVLDDLKRSSLKQSIETTNITEMSEAEFTMFCNQKTEMMVLIITEYLDLMYNIKSTITREQMRKIITLVSDKVIILYKEMYKEIRSIKSEDDGTIYLMTENIKTNAENIRVKLLGDDPLVKIKKTLEIVE